jgi:hypothetical protein
MVLRLLKRLRRSRGNQANAIASHGENGDQEPLPRDADEDESFLAAILAIVDTLDRKQVFKNVAGGFERDAMLA